MDAVYDIEAAFLRSKNVAPGTYRDWNGVFENIHPVLGHLSDQLEDLIAGLDVYHSSRELYVWLEALYGTQARDDFEANARQAMQPQIPPAFANHTDSTAAVLRLSLRYAIESVLKFGTDTEQSPDDFDLKRVWAFAARILELDNFLEHMYLNLVEHHAVVADDYRLGFEPSAFGAAAFNRFHLDFNRIWSEGEVERILDASDHPFSRVEESDLTTSDAWNLFDPAFKEELGYTLTDWFHFMTAALKSFDPTEYLKDIDRREFTEILRKTSGLRRGTIEQILRDALMDQTILERRGRRELLPMEGYWRDERLTARPFVQVNKDGLRRIMWGVEVLSNSMFLTFQRLHDGNRVFVKRTTSNGAIASVAGRLNEASGDGLRDHLIETLKRAGYKCIPEKKSIAKVVGSCIHGPIDVFVADPHHNRMILVEVKDLTFRRTPSEWLKEKASYLNEDPDRELGFLPRLELKKNWFDTHKTALEAECGFPSGSRSEAVVVTGMPVMWVYCSRQPQAVLHYEEFLAKLKHGLPLTSS